MYKIIFKMIDILKVPKNPIGETSQSKVGAG